jgi:hypothetical protein
MARERDTTSQVRPIRCPEANSNGTVLTMRDRLIQWLWRRWNSLTAAGRLEVSQQILFQQHGEALSRAKTQDDRDEQHALFAIEVGMTIDEDAVRFTRQLLRRASRLKVQIPPRATSMQDGENEYWRRSSVTGEHFLKPKGVEILRESIRKEERWRREGRREAATWIGALTGLAGTLTGLLVILAQVLGWWPTAP